MQKVKCILFQIYTRLHFKQTQYVYVLIKTKWPYRAKNEGVFTQKMVNVSPEKAYFDSAPLNL